MTVSVPRYVVVALTGRVTFPEVPKRRTHCEVGAQSHGSTTSWLPLGGDTHDHIHGVDSRAAEGARIARVGSPFFVSKTAWRLKSRQPLRSRPLRQAQDRLRRLTLGRRRATLRQAPFDTLRTALRGGSVVAVGITVLLELPYQPNFVAE